MPRQQRLARRAALLQDAQLGRPYCAALGRLRTLLWKTGNQEVASATESVQVCVWGG